MKSKLGRPDQRWLVEVGWAAAVLYPQGPLPRDRNQTPAALASTEPPPAPPPPGPAAELARRAGADHLAGYHDFRAVTREVSGGTGAAAVYDGVGAATFDQSLDALRPRRYMVLYGASSGPVPPFDPSGWRPAARCSSPARPWATTSPRARICCAGPASCSLGSSGASWTYASARPTRSRTPPGRKDLGSRRTGKLLLPR